MDFIPNKFDDSWDILSNLVEKMNGLKRGVVEVNGLKEYIETSSSSRGLHPRKKLRKNVELWFKNVETMNREVKDLQQKFEESNVVSREFLKKDVLKKIEEVKDISQPCVMFDCLVEVDWIGKALSTTTEFYGAAKICMEEIWAYVMDDSIQRIGVWGTAGVGKTTIMKLIHTQIDLRERESVDDTVIWITASKEMSIINLQNRIARAMDITLDEDEDETIRAGMIYEMLARRGKYVLIIDDLWDNLSLKEVGIPDPEPSNGSKLLVTTRFPNVNRYLGCREVKMHTLSKPDAWGLFSKNVGQDVLNHPDILPIVESVVEECEGLPLVIITIACSMKDVRNIHEWRNALHELKRHGKSVNEMEGGKVFQQLQFCYDRLQDERIKHCFLCCALYPKDFEIDPNRLIKFWISEGLVEKMDSMQMEIDKGHTILNKLKRSGLIEDVVNMLGQHRVKLHDVVREMALRITNVSPQFLVRADLHLKTIPDVGEYWKEDLEKASLFGNRQLKIPYPTPPPKCPNLTTLLLSNCSFKNIPEGFFEEMHGLKVLDLSYNPIIRRLPYSISNLKTFTTLLLGWCTNLERVQSFSKLDALKKLDLRYTKIKVLPDGMEKLVNLKYLKLSGTRIRDMDDGILAKFTSLRQLAFLDSSEKAGLLVRGELIGGLRMLEIFEGEFYDLNAWNRYAQALDAGKSTGPRQYRIYVDHHRSEISKDELYYESKKFINLNGCNICSTQGVKIPSDVECLSILHCIADLCEDEDESFSIDLLSLCHFYITFFPLFL